MIELVKGYKALQLRRLSNKYLQSKLYTLSDCYKNYSEEKYEAYQLALTTVRQLNGYMPKIISYNKHMFTIGFMFAKDGFINFGYITRSYDRYIPIAEI